MQQRRTDKAADTNRSGSGSGSMIVSLYLKDCIRLLLLLFNHSY